MDFVEDVGVFY